MNVSIGTGGYYVGIDWLTNLTPISDSSTIWTVSQPSGTDLIFQVTDSNGQVAYIQNIKVGESDDASCLNESSSMGGGESSSTNGESGSYFVDGFG